MKGQGPEKHVLLWPLALLAFRPAGVARLRPRLRIAQQTAYLTRPRAFHAVEEADEDQRLIQRLNGVVFAFVKDEQVMGAKLPFNTVGAGENPLAL